MAPPVAVRKGSNERPLHTAFSASPTRTLSPFLQSRVSLRMCLVRHSSSTV
ncbi:cobyrinate a,c-diamide synthase [Sesbania bispinosa]|nr:cobyrinate a,c-diamide synthase [Sesbania bispinosa]